MTKHKLNIHYPQAEVRRARGVFESIYHQAEVRRGVFESGEVSGAGERAPAHPPKIAGRKPRK